MRSFIYIKAKVGFHFMKRGSARFILGDHPQSEILRSLEHNPEPLFSGYIPEAFGVLDDYFDCWFITSKNKPEEPFGDGLEKTYPLGYSEDWLDDPIRDPDFDLNGD